MARQPRDRGGEGQYGQRAEPRQFALSTANLYAGTQPGGFLYGLGDEQSRQHHRALRRRSQRNSARPTIRSSAKRLAASSPSAAAWRSMTPTASSAASASAATPPAPTTTSPGACGRRWVSTRFPAVPAPTTMTRSSTTSRPTRRASRASAIRCATASEAEDRATDPRRLCAAMGEDDEGAEVSRASGRLCLCGACGSDRRCCSSARLCAADAAAGMRRPQQPAVLQRGRRRFREQDRRVDRREA